MTNRTFLIRSVQMAENIDLVELVDGNSQVSIRDFHLGNPDRTLVFVPGRLVTLTINPGTATEDEQ